MKLNILFVALASAPLLSFATDVMYSTPVGGMTITVPVGRSISVALPLLNYTAGSGVTSGIISSVGSSYIDVANANWSPGAYSDVTLPYYLRITSGSSAGRIMLVSTTTANTSTRLYVYNDGVDLSGADGVIPGNAYELIPADTLNSLFGTSLFGGTDAASADNVLVWGGASWQTFYYNTQRDRWELNGLSTINANNKVLRPDRGFFVIRRSTAGDFKMWVTGRVPEMAPRYFNARPGNTFLSLGIPVAQTLGQLGLETRAPGWITGTSAANADNIQVWGGASWQVFYYDSTNLRWQLNGLPSLNANNTNLLNRPVMVRRLATAPASESLITLPIPYTN